MKSFFARHRIAAFILGVAVSIAAGAAAAFLVYSGISGSAGGKATSTINTVGAITLASDYADASELSPGGNADAAFYVTDNNPSAGAVVISSLNVGAITSSIAGCEVYAHFIDSPTQPFVGRSYPLGTSHQAQVLPGSWSLDANTPATCAGATFDVALTGTTTP